MSKITGALSLLGLPVSLEFTKGLIQRMAQQQVLVDNSDLNTPKDEQKGLIYELGSAAPKEIQLEKINNAFLMMINWDKETCLRYIQSNGSSTK